MSADGQPPGERTSKAVTYAEYLKIDELLDLQRTRTDEDGEFLFEGLSAGAWVVGPAPRKQKWTGGRRGEAAIAPATARTASRLPIRFATSVYETTHPGGIESSARHTWV